MQIVPHHDYFMISGVLAPRVRMNSAGVGILMWTDQPCGKFGRDVGINLAPGTEVCTITGISGSNLVNVILYNSLWF